MTTELASPQARTSTPSAQKPPRLVSLDVFRGITIAAMILVNNPGSWDSVFPPLRHAEWHGCTLADLVFPSFLFILGTAIVFSNAHRARQGRRRMLLHALWRSLALIALGLLLNGLFYLPWANVRLPGVLQRIGILYLSGSLITMALSRRARTVLCLLLLVGYWALMAGFSAPGHPRGDLSPHGNLASFVDRQLLSGHMWHTNGDPEGILTTFPALVTVLLGTLAGDWLRSPNAPRRIASRLALAGAAGVLAGLLWNLVFPVNKNLWTSSYVLLTAGIASLALAACYSAVDVCCWRRWAAPFKAVGMNPLAIYVASEIAAMSVLDNARSWTYTNLLAPLAGNTAGSLCWALVYVAFWWVVAWVLYRRNIFIKL